MAAYKHKETNNDFVTDTRINGNDGVIILTGITDTTWQGRLDFKIDQSMLKVSSVFANPRGSRLGWILFFELVTLVSTMLGNRGVTQLEISGTMDEKAYPFWLAVGLHPVSISDNVTEHQGVGLYASWTAKIDDVHSKVTEVVMAKFSGGPHLK